MLIKDASKTPPKIPKKVLVLAEAPMVPKYSTINEIIQGDVDLMNIPKPLRDIYDRYEPDLKEFGTYHTELINLTKTYTDKYLADHPGLTISQIPNQDFDEKIVAPATNAIGDKAIKMKELEGRLDELNKEYVNSPANPKVRKPTFLVEAENIKDFYKDKNVDVEIIPTYKGSGTDSKVQSALKQLPKDSDIIFLGHKGNMLGGYSHKEMSDLLASSPASDCYFGSCSFEEYLPNYSNLKGKSIYYRPDTKHLGVTPSAPDFLNAMFGRRLDENGAPTVTPVKYGSSYKVAKFDKGGIVLPQYISDLIERLKQ